MAEDDFDAVVAKAEKEGESFEGWQSLLREAVRRGRTQDAQLQPFLAHLSSGTQQTVDLSGCAEAGDAFLRQAAERWPETQTLLLDGARRIGDDGLRAVAAGLPRLETLSLRFGAVPEKALLALLALPLRALLLSGTVGVTEGVLLKLLPKLAPALERLELSHLRTGVVTAGVVKQIGKSLPALKSLELSWSGDFGDALSKLVGRCTGLVRLGIADSKTSESSLAKLLAGNPGLASLDVSGCAALLQGSCEKLAKNLGAVRCLSVGAPTLTDQTLARLVAGAAGVLEELDINGSHKLTPEGLRAALEPAKHLRVLVVGTCKLISEKTVASIKEASPALHIFHVVTKN